MSVVIERLKTLLFTDFVFFCVWIDRFYHSFKELFKILHKN